MLGGLYGGRQTCEPLILHVSRNRRARTHTKEKHTLDWRHRAACLTEDPELFFPIGNSGPALAQVEQAKRVCNRCEVSDICLKWALDTGQDAGVWGGLSEEERRSLKRRTARARRSSMA